MRCLSFALLLSGCVRSGELDRLADSEGIDLTDSLLVSRCDPATDQVIHDLVIEADRECEEAWYYGSGHAAAGERMMNVKLHFETHEALCDGAEGAPDFWDHLQIWRPNEAWGSEWDWCFGAYLDRQSVCAQ